MSEDIININSWTEKVFDILIVKIPIQNISFIIGHEYRFTHINLNLLLCVPITHLISSKSLIILNILNQELRIWKQPKLNGWWAIYTDTDIQRWNEWRRILCDIRMVAPTDISKKEIKKIQNTNKSITEASSQVKIFWSAPIYINPWPNWKNIFGFTIALSSESTNFWNFATSCSDQSESAY